MSNLIKTVKIESMGAYAVFFTREYKEDWGYMGMRDYKTYEPTEKFGIDVVKYNSKGIAHSSDAGYRKDSFCARGFGKDMANKIWYNVKHGISYKALRDAMAKEGFITKEA